MGRGKVKLQRIDDDARRHVTFSKRRSGLLKKGHELAVLCDAEVAIVVISPKGKISSFSSQSSIEATFERYARFLEAEKKAMSTAIMQAGTSVDGRVAVEEEEPGNVQTDHEDSVGGGGQGGTDASPADPIPMLQLFMDH